jgi:predicted nucleic acid-binding protein
MPGRFFDTNVLLYITSSDPAKADRTEELIHTGGMISVQVLNEIANVARRKMGMSWTETRAFLSMIRGLLPVQPLTIEIHETSLALAERYGLSIYNAMIAASALYADCDTLWSEDMEDGILLDDRLRVVIVLRLVTSRHRGAGPARRRFRPIAGKKHLRGEGVTAEPALRRLRARTTASGLASMPSELRLGHSDPSVSELSECRWARSRS